MFKIRDPRKQVRFRRPEFQAKLQRARRFKRKQPPPTQFSRRILKLLALFVVFLLFYFLAISKVLLVEKAILKSDKGPSGEQVSSALARMSDQRVFLIPRNHILLLTKENLLSSLQQELPQVRQITSFRKVFPNRIEIALEERTPRYIWQSGVNYYLMDQDGVIFQLIRNYNPAIYPQLIIQDRLAADITVGERIEVERQLVFVRELEELWPKSVGSVSYTQVSLPAKESPDIFARTSSGFDVYFDVNRTVRGQLASLNLVLNQEIDPQNYSGLAYIDLRLPEIAYYCYKDAPCVGELKIESEK